jgi:hypothetical protein
MKHPWLSALSLALPVTASALNLVESTFDTGHEGWKATNGLSSRAWVPDGGMPGGYVQATDNGQGTVWFFEAPAAYLGDQTAALGGTLSFWLKVSTLARPMTTPWADVKVSGNGLMLALDAGPSPGLDWTSYRVSLTPGAWRLGTVDGPLAGAAEIATVFAAIDQLWIRGEYSAWWDTGSLDSVVLASPVPELPAGALLAAGLAALAGCRRRG